MSQPTPDVIVIGAGHNTLTAAAYLARCGLGVRVLEQGPAPGGGAVSRELTLPGFVHDLHATGVSLLQTNPLLTHDELGLKSRHGLQFAYAEINALTIFADGDTIASYNDIDKTCAEIAKFSAKDADAYRNMVGFMQQVMPLVGMSMARPPVSLGAFIGMLERAPFGQPLILAMMKSAYDIAAQLFEHPKVRMHFLKRVADTSCSPEEKCTGLNMLLMIGASAGHPIGAVVGGTAALSRAMVHSIEADGGEVCFNMPVRRVLNRDGKARAVELADGSILEARKAVVAAIHPHRLGKMVDNLDAGMLQRARETVPSSYGTFTVHAAIDGPVSWNIGSLPERSFTTNIIDTDQLEDFRRNFDELRYGVVPKTFVGGVIVNSNPDPSRAPAGKHTLYCYVFSPFALKDGGSEHWDDIKAERTESIMRTLARYAKGFGPGQVLAQTSESPLDMMRHSPSFQGGDIMGVGSYLFQSLGMRPTAELAQYRVPGADGLYLCGPFMHPGGGITGGGRPVAIRVMEDLKVDYAKVIRT